jgi:hypothetical protein
MRDATTNDAIAFAKSRNPFANRGNLPADFDAWREGRLGSGRMLSTASHDVDVIHADRVGLDQHFTGCRFRLRDVLVSHYFRAAVLAADNRLHEFVPLAAPPV